MSFTTPDSYTEVKYFIKFSNIENFIDVSGSEDFIVTKPGTIPIVKRNKDFTIQIMTFSFDIYSTREILRGQKIKVSRNNLDIFFGFVDDLKYDKNKNLYTVKVAHEFKLLQRYNIRKSELEDSLTGVGSITRINKYLLESVLEREIDFTEAENYEPLGAGNPSLLSATYPLKVFGV